MTKIYVLIIALSQGMSQGGSSSITAEFYSKDKCNIALENQIKQIKRNTAVDIISSGCYEK
jgi:hypothetical protein